MTSETRLTEALRSESQSAPTRVGLAGRARGRGRAPGGVPRIAAVGAAPSRRWRIPVAVVALGGDGGAGNGAGRRRQPLPTDLEPVRSGRWESWRGVTVLVPEDWEYGDQATWCAGRRVRRDVPSHPPGGVTVMIACTPASSYGLLVPGDRDERPTSRSTGRSSPRPATAWPPAHVRRRARRERRARHRRRPGPRRTARRGPRAPSSAYRRTVDPNGCGATGVEPRTCAGRDGRCRCAATTSTGRSSRASRCDDEDAVAAAAALDAAPHQGDLDCQPSDDPAGHDPDARRDPTTCSIELDGACTVVEGIAGGRDRRRVTSSTGRCRRAGPATRRDCRCRELRQGVTTAPRSGPSPQSRSQRDSSGPR